jgi:UDP-N-acetylmuramate: L-alanyl-gamma-D-glutamyl-meso-diaminopimelate ligase
MHLHFLGICGTFMGSLAQLAKSAGHQVSGCDANVYPPMSNQLQQAGIDLVEGFDPAQLKAAPDLIIVGNALSRGNPCIEYMLDNKLAYTSGPQWLGENILKHKHVISVSGTHGKTSTSSMLAKILDTVGYHPGYLIGGVPKDFGVSARIGGAAADGKKYFVIEADEYDTAFFDKRSKFVHYHSNSLIINNLEYDHADIFDDLAAIQRQFHHCVRTLPSNGNVIFPAANSSVLEVLEQGCWSQQLSFGAIDAPWQYELLADDGSAFVISHKYSNQQATVKWQLSGLHNVNNAVAAIVAASEVGISLQQACDALSSFVGIKRRMESIYSTDNITIYDDFAHHPTAIKTTLEGLRTKVGDAQIMAVIEPRSATMKLGVHQQALSAVVSDSDQVFWYQNSTIDWDLASVAKSCPVPALVAKDIHSLLDAVESAVEANQKPAKPVHIVIMSNGGFEDFHRLLVERLK